MICPIISSGVNSELHHVAFAECQKEKCQWWINGNCVVHEYLHLIPVLKDVQSEIYKGFEKLNNGLVQLRKKY